MLSSIKKFIVEYSDSFKTRFFPKLSNVPHMEMTTTAVLREKLSTTVAYIEYGAGGSTLLAMTIQVPSIVSVETDRRWIQRIKNSSRKVGSTSQLELLHADIGKVTSWGQPSNSKTIDGFQNYALLPWATSPKSQSQGVFVLIDGRYRVLSLIATFISAPLGTEVLFDDYFERVDYHAVERVVLPVERFGRAAFFRIERQYAEHEFQEIINEFRYTSD